MISKEIKKRKVKIDAVDSEMIMLLQKDGRISNTAMAKILGIAESTVRTRLKRLIDTKIIQIVAVSSPFDLGFQVAGNFKITIDIKKKDTVMKELAAINELKYVVLTTGGIDVDADFILSSFEDLEPLIFEKINKIDGIKQIETSLILQWGKNVFDWGTVIT